MCSLFSLSFRLTPVTEPRTNIDIEATTHSRVDGLDQFLPRDDNLSFDRYCLQGCRLRLRIEVSSIGDPTRALTWRRSKHKESAVLNPSLAISTEKGVLPFTPEPFVLA